MCSVSIVMKMQEKPSTQKYVAKLLTGSVHKKNKTKRCQPVTKTHMKSTKCTYADSVDDLQSVGSFFVFALQRDSQPLVFYFLYWFIGSICHCCRQCSRYFFREDILVSVVISPPVHPPSTHDPEETRSSEVSGFTVDLLRSPGDVSVFALSCSRVWHPCTCVLSALCITLLYTLFVCYCCLLSFFFFLNNVLAWFKLTPEML